MLRMMVTVMPLLLVAVVGCREEPISEPLPTAVVAQADAAPRPSPTETKACPGAQLDQSAAISLALTEAFNERFEISEVITSALLTNAKLYEVAQFQTDDGACAWYVAMEGYKLHDRWPPWVELTPTPSTGTTYTEMKVALNAVTGLVEGISMSTDPIFTPDPSYSYELAATPTLWRSLVPPAFDTPTPPEGPADALPPPTLVAPLPAGHPTPHRFGSADEVAEYVYELATPNGVWTEQHVKLTLLRYFDDLAGGFVPTTPSVPPHPIDDQVVWVVGFRSEEIVTNDRIDSVVGLSGIGDPNSPYGNMGGFEAYVVVSELGVPIAAGIVDMPNREGTPMPNGVWTLDDIDSLPDAP